MTGIRPSGFCKIIVISLSNFIIFQIFTATIFSLIMRNFFSILTFTLFFIPVFAQKKPLDHHVYDHWQRITTPTISPDGKAVLYSITPQQGDASLVLSETNGRKLNIVPRGEAGQFTNDGQFAISLIKPPFSVVRQAKIKKKKKYQMPLDSLAIITLANQSVYKAPRVRSYKLPDESSAYIAYLELDTTSKDTMHQSGILHLRQLATGQENTFEQVSDYYFDPAGNQLVFIRSSQDSLQHNVSNAGVFLYQIPQKNLKKISQGRGTYQQFAFDQTGTQLAFVAEKSPKKALQKPYSLYYYTAGTDTAHIVASISSSGMPTNWNVSGNGAIQFSQNGEKLFFGIAPIPPIKDTTIVDFEVAQVDIWNWKDDYLQPKQLVDLKKDREKSYLSVMYPKRGRNIIPLGSLDIPNVVLTDDANQTYALGITNIGKRVAAQWEGNSPKDIYLISTTDGSKKKIASDIYGPIELSPTGLFAVWFNMATKQWNSYDISTNRLQILNTDLPVSFADEDNDSPTFPTPYGIAGWAAADKEVYIYDKYDIWSFALNGTDVRLLTNGAGRSNQITFRYVSTKPKLGRAKHSRYVMIDPHEPLLLSAFNHTNKEHGFYFSNPRNKRDPKEAVIGPYTYRAVASSADGQTFIYTKENYVLPPDLYVSGNFKNETQLSAINLQQKQYNWGTAELVKWTTPAGHEASGILYKPEDFNPAKKYPLIAYFYEKLSDGLYNYIPPEPTASRLNISYFVSNGYLVFAPDIHYQIGHPAKSAEEYVNSGVSELAKFPWVDEKRLGIQGQSWGGYQVAHLITSTNLYAAAWAGAPVVNMTSAYGGIRWGSGLNRQFQYEKTQSRIGQNLWDGYDLYIENSPLFHLQSVNTPVVIMANDHDGAVPWYQGIEMFTALRRLGKPVWLLNYNGEEHNLVKRQNRKDIQIREQQFFDHYLKGKPAPVWLEKGVPATLKGIDWGLDLVQ